MLPPFIQPNAASACSNAALRATASTSPGGSWPTTTMCRFAPDCCARASIGQTAATPIPEMNCLLLTVLDPRTILKIYHIEERRGRGLPHQRRVRCGAKGDGTPNDIGRPMKGSGAMPNHHSCQA